jgi:hypothetical protein
VPRRCTVCDHSERHTIDESLVTGAPYRSVAKRFGLSESAVYRHKVEHLPAHLLKAREVEEIGAGLGPVHFLGPVLESRNKCGAPGHPE